MNNKQTISYECSYPLIMSRNNPQTLQVPSYGYYNPRQWTLIDALTCSDCQREGCKECGWSGEIWLLAEKNLSRRSLRI